MSLCCTVRRLGSMGTRDVQASVASEESVASEARGVTDQ
jgi:hypothetical protein